MINASLKELSQALSAKQISSVELTGLFLKRIEALNPDLNALLPLTRNVLWLRQRLLMRSALRVRLVC